MGSFGLGKGVLWRHSGISTVVFSSVVDRPGTGNIELRLFGRSVLASHELATGERYDSSGFLGTASPVDGFDKDRSVSIWEEEDLAKKLHVHRKVEIDYTGTTALIIDFHDPELEVQLGPEPLVSQIKDRVCEWFWPGLVTLNTSKALEVEVWYRKNDLDSIFRKCDPSPEWDRFIEAHTQADNAADIQRANQKCSSAIDVEIPGRKDEPETNHRCQIDVRVKSGGPQEREHPHREKIALMRRNLMVVEYSQIRADMPENCPVFGVAAAGFSFGESEGDKALHDFLRASEPPKHENWKFRDNVSAHYKRGGQAAQKRIYNEIDQKSRELAQGAPNTNNQPIPALARFFKFGAVGSSHPEYKKYLSDVQNTKVPSLGHWIIRGTLNCDGNPTRWSTDVRFVVEGAGRNSVTVLNATTATTGATVTYQDDILFCEVVQDDRIEFDVTLELDTTIFKPGEVENLFLEIVI